MRAPAFLALLIAAALSVPAGLTPGGTVAPQGCCGAGADCAAFGTACCAPADDAPGVPPSNRAKPTLTDTVREPSPAWVMHPPAASRVSPRPASAPAGSRVMLALYSILLI